MKKLTWALLSLMLFLGLGVAFAENDEGGGDEPATSVTVPKPTFTPADGTEVEQGEMILFTVPEELLDQQAVFFCFIFDNETEELKPVFSSEEEMMMALYGMSDYDYNIAGYMGGQMAAPYEGIPIDATVGSHKMRVRAAVPVMSAPEGDDEDAEPTFKMYYSEVAEATYTVKAAVKVSTPSITPETGSTIEYAKPYAISLAEDDEDNPFIHLYYVLDKEDNFDFSTYTRMQDLEADGAKLATSGSNILLTKSVTVKAAACKYVAAMDENGGDNDKLYAWSDPVSATYTVGKPAAPTFTPAGNTEQAYGATVTLASTNHKTVSIYYTTDGNAPTTESTKFDAKKPIELTKNMTIKAIAVGEDPTNVSAVTEATYTVGKPADPTFEPAAGTVLPGTKVTLKSTDHKTVSIYYTTDGTEPSVSSTLYSEPFALTASATVKAIAVGEDPTNVSTVTEAEYTVKMPAPTFSPASGATVDFGAELTISCADEDAMILYTFDGSEPSVDNDNAHYYNDYFKAKITATTIKAVSYIYDGDDVLYSDVVTATYTFNPITATLSLVPMKEDTVGKNVGTGVEFSINGWEEYPATVYYTLDGTTVPSKEAFEAQADKVNGAIKKLAVEWEEYEENGDTYRNIVTTDGHALAITFDKATRLKAIGYITLAGQNVVTPVLDTMLQIKSEAKPTFSFVEGKMIKAGDKLVIENPNNIGVRPEAPDYPENPTEENLAAWEKAMDAWDVEMEKYNALADATPATTLYFSFDGTQPTSAAYGRQPEDKYEEWSVFRAERTNVTILFKKDEKGLFAHVPYITGSFPTAADTIRIENGKFAVQALAVTTAAAEEGEEGEGGVMPSAKGSDEEAAFMYGSDFASAEYALLTLPATVTKPTFVPAPAAGALAKGDVIKWTMDAAYQAYKEEGLVAVAYVVNGSDADLTIDEAKLEKLIEDKATGYTGYRQDGKVYLYEAETDAFPIEKASTVKARQIVAIAYEIEAEDPDAEPEVKIEFKLSEIETATYTVDATKLQKPSFKTPIAGSTVEPKSPITFEMPLEYDWSAYGNLAYILYVENDNEVKLEGTAEEITNVVPKDPTTDAKAGEPGYKVVECALMGDDLSWTKALIETEEGALTIRARLAGVTKEDKVFYSDEITVSCTVAKGEGPGDTPGNPDLPETVKAPTFVPAAGAVDKGTAITWTWDESYNEETYPLVAVAYVVDGEDADLDITVENFMELWEASQDEDEETVREEGVTYLYRTDVDDAYPYHIEKACTVKARMLLGVMDAETNEVSLALSPIVEAAYTLKGEPVTPAVELTFNPASGSEVDENTAVTITANQEVEIFYMMFESEAAAKAAEWNQEEALSYSGELKPVLTKEKNTIKAAYALADAEAVSETFFYATYTVKELPAIELTFNPATGSEVENNTTVTVTANREVEIYYNLYADKAAADADTTFARNAKEVTEDGMPVITKGNTYLRCGVTDRGAMKYFDATYTIKVANEDLELAGVSVYPNPSNGLFNLELPVAATVEVFMSNGVLYQRLTLGEGSATLNIERSGIYFLRITGEGRTTVKRLIVR